MFDRISFDDYKAIQAINMSTLKAMAVSPLQYRHVADTERPDTSSMMLGRATHSHILEPTQFYNEYTVWNGKGTRASKAYKEFAAENEGKEILTPAEMAKIAAMGQAVRSHPIASLMLQNGTPEVSIQWTDPDTGLRCKGRPDWVSKDAVVDLKTTADLSPHMFERQAFNLSYHMAAAFYSDGLNLVHGLSLPFYIAAVQSTAPHDVIVYKVPEKVLTAGRVAYRGLLVRVSECEAAGRWPGMADEVQQLTLPAWAATKKRTDAGTF